MMTNNEVDMYNLDDLALLKEEERPQKLYELYSGGLCGLKHDPIAEYRVKQCAVPLYEYFAKAKGHGKGRVSLPFKAMLTFDDPFGTGAQEVNDCASWSCRNAGSIDYGVDALFGETTFEGQFATEHLYGARGDRRDAGASCARLATYVSLQGSGGFLVRKKYSDGSNAIDFTNYSGRRAISLGPHPPDWLNKIASKNKSLRVFTVKTLEEIRDAISLGFGIMICSGQGFSNRRNEDGLCEAKGSWAHAQVVLGVNDTDWSHQKYGGMLTLIGNSWGSWNSGPKTHDQPNGSYWARPKVVKGMSNSGYGGCIAIASVRGFNRELVYDTMHKIAQLSND